MSELNTNEDMNETVDVVIEDSSELTAPIDTTLTVSGAAADAKAVGDRFLLVEGKTAAEIYYSSATGAPTVAAAIDAAAERTGADIPVNGSEVTTIAEKLAEVQTAAETASTRTGADIPVNGSEATTIAAKIEELEESADNRTADQIKLSATDDTTVTEALASRLKSVNGVEADETGNAEITSVSMADNLTSTQAQTTTGDFIVRTTGGSSSLPDGDGWLLSVQGNRKHLGYVAEVLDMTVTAMERSAGVDPITAEIDRAVFVAYVQASGTTTLIYTTEWSADPELYGVTVTGTPVSGDYITIDYTKEEPGTIVQSNPRRYVSTGWNLYNHTNGYARVCNYSEEYGYMISGAYTALAFAETVDGEQETIPVIDGHFDVPGEGYLFVTGGDSTTTAIWTTWSDWDDGYEGNFEAYTEKVVDLTPVMTRYFPYGLMQVGTLHDEINLNTGIAVSYVTRMANNEANMAAARATGRVFEYDEQYIYIARASAEMYSISLDGQVNVYEYGTEFFDETEMSVTAQVMYGNNLKNKLERDVLTISAQTLTNPQKTQARTNIGAASAADLSSLSDSFTNFSYTALANGTDLNDITEIGFYGTSSNAATASLEHCPASGSGISMLVTQRGGNRIQTIFHAAKIYCRASTSSGWTPWYEFSGTQVS